MMKLPFNVMLTQLLDDLYDASSLTRKTLGKFHLKRKTESTWASGLTMAICSFEVVEVPIILFKIFGYQ